MLQPCASPENGQFTVRLRGVGGQVLGSGVLLAPQWALSVSHVLCTPQAQVRIETVDDDQAKVVALHWPPEARHRLEPDSPWPVLQHAAHDHLLLLRLDRALGNGRRPRLTEAAGIGAGCPLWLRSWGVDAAGNYPQAPIALPLRARAADPGLPRFGLAEVSPGQAPRQGHSGGGVFAGEALLGLHSHRRVDRQPELAAYVALDPCLIRWLHTTLQEAA
jgi:hypothetical protein